MGKGRKQRTDRSVGAFHSKRSARGIRTRLARFESLEARQLLSGQGWNFWRADLTGTNYQPHGSQVQTTEDLQLEKTLGTSWSMSLTGDVDGDGKIELVRTENDQLYIYDHRGQLQTQRTMPTTGYVWMLDDVDGNGTIDIGVSGKQGSSTVAYCFFYDGSGTLMQTFQRGVGYDGSIRPVAVVAPGKVLVHGEAGYSRNPRGMFLYDYASGGVDWSYGLGFTTMNDSVADIDGDGRLECTVDWATVHNGHRANGTTDGELYLVVIDDDGTNLLTTKYPSPDNGSARHVFHDFNKDGVHETLAIEQHDPRYHHGYNEVHLYDLDGNITRTYTGPYNEMWWWAVADVDDDGWDNVVVGGRSVLTILDQQLNEVRSINEDGYVQVVVDLTGDGREEIVTKNSSNLLRVYDNELNLIDSIQLPGSGTNSGGTIADDIDGDGVVELVVQSSVGSHVVGFAASSEAPPQLLYRESLHSLVPFKPNIVPGVDHVAFFPGGSSKVLESQLSQLGDYYDPTTGESVFMYTPNGVQQTHTLGSFWHNNNQYDQDGNPLPSTTDFALSRSVTLTDYLADDVIKEMEAFMEERKDEGAPYLPLEGWLTIGSPLYNFLAKGGDGKFTCVGLVEAAAEHGGVNLAEGFVPNFVEAALPLSPSLQLWCIVTDIVTEQLTNMITGWLDPVDFILTDPLGRRLGHANGIEYREIPDAFYSGDGEFESLLIPNRIDGEYRLELFGIGDEYAGEIRYYNSEFNFDSWSFSGVLAEDEARDVTLNGSPTISEFAVTSELYENQTGVLQAAFANPDATSQHSAEIRWQEGVTVPGIVTEADGTGVVEASHTYVDDGEYLVNLTLTDDDGDYDEDAAAVLVHNLPPVADVDGSIWAVAGESLDVVLLSTDASPVDQAAGFTYTVNWDDGSGEQEVSGPSGVELSHTYSEIGTYTIEVTATDKDGSVSEIVHHTVEVSHTTISDGVLRVGGTNDDDFIVVLPHRRQISIMTNFSSPRRQSFDSDEVNEIEIYALDGDDRIFVTPSVYCPTFLYGGPGNDRLHAGGGPAYIDGGAGKDSIHGGRADDFIRGGEGNDFILAGFGNDIILGGDGRDHIVPGFGRNIAIGGRDHDSLMGSIGGDILISGTTIHDANDEALSMIMEEWASGRSYQTRIQNIRGEDNYSFEDRLNGEYYLVVDGEDATVLDDDSRDWLFGGPGFDWFFANEKQDRVLGRRRWEIVDKLMMME